MHYKERIALHNRLSYVHLSEDGQIGLISTSAGQCLATMDRIAQHGSKASNFCDLGGNAQTEKIIEALVLLEKDAVVKVILMNLFLGNVPAMNVANAIVSSYANNYIQKPIVVRLRGLQADAGFAKLEPLEKEGKLFLA